MAWQALSAPSQAQVTSPEPLPWSPSRLMLWYDQDMSGAAGADDILTLHYAVYRIEDKYLPPRLWSESWWLGKAGGIAYRLAKGLLLDDNIIPYYAAVPQHEIFGHGFRAREFGFTPIRYSFSPPPPFGKGNAMTEFTDPGPGNVSVDQNLAVSMAGVEASAVLAVKLRGYWALSGAMDFHGALLYLYSSGDLGNYLSGTDESFLDSTNTDFSNDMLSYVYTLNTQAGAGDRSQYRLHLKRMEKNSLISYADPFYWYSLWTVLKTGLWSGESVFKYPALPLGPVRYLPAAGYGLTPWGPEYWFDNIAAWDRTSVTLRIRIGDDTFRNFWGTDLTAVNILSLAGADLDFSAHLWKQPRLRLDPNDQGVVRDRLGGGGDVTILSPTLPTPWPVRLAAGGGYKALGFVPGEELEQGFNWRIGLDVEL